ncbi:hypothetical protein FOA52_005864 [Chlamydomonas sp. UWO 241]|nr:hypothetical protein FOA52_005864 [Chlamydomonas sp. UWO 241]
MGKHGAWAARGQGSQEVLALLTDLSTAIDRLGSQLAGLEARVAAQDEQQRRSPDAPRSGVSSGRRSSSSSSSGAWGQQQAGGGTEPWVAAALGGHAHVLLPGVGIYSGGLPLDTSSTGTGPLPHASSASLHADPDSLHDAFLQQIRLPPSLHARPHDIPRGIAGAGQQQQQQQQQQTHQQQQKQQARSSSSSSRRKAAQRRTLQQSGDVLPITSNFSGSPRMNLTGGVRIICISPWTPMCTCEAGQHPSTYTGFMVEMFRKVAEELSWDPDSWAFRCMVAEDLWSGMLDVDGKCYMAGSGQEMSNRWIGLGIKFAVPVYRTGLSIIVKGTSDTPNMFAMFQVFHWDVWVALVCTAVGMSFVIFGLDHAWLSAANWSPNTHGGRHARLPSNAVAPAPQEVAAAATLLLALMAAAAGGGPWYDRVGMGLYNTAGKMVDAGEPEPMTVPSRVAVLAYGLLVMLMLALFTANTAAQVTTAALSSAINGPGDLSGKYIATWPQTIDRLVNSWSVDRSKATIIDLPGCCDEVAYLPYYNNREVDCLVVPTQLATYLASFWCDAIIVGAPFETVFVGFGFPGVTPDEDVYSMSNAIIALDQRTFIIEDYTSRYITDAGGSGCGVSTSQRTMTLESVSFKQVSGLWVILVAAVGAALLLTLGRWLWRRRALKEAAAAEAAAAGGTATIAPPKPCPGSSSWWPFRTNASSTGTGGSNGGAPWAAGSFPAPGVEADSAVHAQASRNHPPAPA